MNFAIRPNVFLWFDAAGASVRTVIDPMKLSITGYYAKINDSTFGVNSAPPDDPAFWTAVYGSELYAVDMNVPLNIGTMGNIKPGAFFVYQAMRTGGNAGIGGTPTIGTGYPINKFGVGTDDAYLYWLGVYLNGKMGPMPMELDFIYQGGRASYTNLTHTTLGSWLIRGWMSYIFQGLEVGAGAMYVQGEDYAKYTNTTQPAQYVPGAGTHSSRFLLPQSATDAVPGDSMVYTGGWMGTGINAHNGAFLAPEAEYPGFWYARLFAYYNVFEWLKLGAQVLYLGNTDKHEEGKPFVIYWQGNRGMHGNDRIGWEMDYGVNLKIYKNLSFNGAFGYLFAGRAMDTDYSGGSAGMNLTVGRPNDPWIFAGLLLYTF
jgi:hypothetical protein